MKRNDHTRVGVVSYTNVMPLVEFLPQTYPQVRIESLVPSELGKRMAENHLDVALLSSIELLRNPRNGFIPGLGICSDGAVRSVCLFSTKEPSKLKTVALDRSSLTSIVLLKILFAEYWGHTPEFVWYTPPVKNGLQIADAALSIGDASLVENHQNVEYIDLGAEWKSMTGLPFIYALWITRPGFDSTELHEPFTEAKRLGLSHVDQLAAKCSEQHGIPQSVFQEYFTKNIIYDVSSRELEGMQLFFKLAKPFLL